MLRFLTRPVILAGILLLLTSLRVLTAPVTVSGSTPISLAEYWEAVEHTRQMVVTLQASSPEKLATGLELLVSQWEAIQQVEMEDGQVVSIDNGYLLLLLRSTNTDLSQIKIVLETLQAAHQKYPGELFTTSDLESLNAILADPQFQWKEAAVNPISEWVNQLLEKIARWLDKLSGRQGDGTVTVNVPSIPFLPTLLSICLVVILAYIFRSLLIDLVAEARMKGGSDDADEVLTADAAFSRAQTLSRGGDYRSAVRFLYLSALLMLNERGLMHYDRSKTNREYLSSVSQSPELAEPLRDVIDVFDNVWYGYHTLDEGTFKHYSDRVEELKEKKQA
jgi:hypothetical protein